MGRRASLAGSFNEEENSGEGLSWVETRENKGGGEDRGALVRGGVQFRNSKLVGAI